jgi:hypothetical protein
MAFIAIRRQDSQEPETIPLPPELTAEEAQAIRAEFPRLPDVKIIVARPVTIDALFTETTRGEILEPVAVEFRDTARITVLPNECFFSPDDMLIVKPSKPFTIPCDMIQIMPPEVRGFPAPVPAPRVKLTSAAFLEG